MKRVLVTGAGGFLGAALVRSAAAGTELHGTRRTSPVVGCAAHDVDLAERSAVDALWHAVRPELVIHTAYRMDAGERDIWLATRNVVDATAAAGAALVHLSTDLVLDGESGPYPESAEPAPVNEYGRWKARAERYVRETMPSAAVVRTSLLTSFDPPDPRSAWVARGLRGDAPLRLFSDEIRCPIAVADLALQLWEIASLDGPARAGVWHLAGPEALSRFALGLLIADALGRDAARIEAAPSTSAPEPRPRDLRLLTSRADAALATRARPVSVLAAEARVARIADGG
jgi:dTDP-4-dehydrorhamnose reductase